MANASYNLNVRLGERRHRSYDRGAKDRFASHSEKQSTRLINKMRAPSIIVGRRKFCASTMRLPLRGSHPLCVSGNKLHPQVIMTQGRALPRYYHTSSLRYACARNETPTLVWFPCFLAQNMNLTEERAALRMKTECGRSSPQLFSLRVKLCGGI